MSFEMKACSAV